jgi:TP901 family phage tail tape measure protein
LKLISQTDRLTESLKRQKMTFSDIIKNRKALGQVYKEQIALQNSLANMWGTDAKGAIKADLIVPKDLDPKLRTLGSRLGYINQLMLVGADHMVKWGKNMQWAGRQLSMGFTLPVVLAGAVMGKFAYDVDKALTQVVKVYGDANAQFQESNKDIRDDTWRTAQMMSKAYGQAATDTIEITAQLAAAGRTGTKLQADTAAVTRARVLGELDLQDAMKATITMQSVYNYNSEQLGDAFNYINAMENQTVLTAQDFVTAIPKVSGVMNTLGGDLKDVGALMTAFKAAGIDAAEGANALKSINFRLVATYNRGLETFRKETGQSLKQIVEETGGKTVPTLIRFADAIKDLNAAEKVAVTRDVFGIYQGSKALTMLEQLTGQSEQLSRALAVGQNSVEENAAIAAREIQTLNAQPFMKLRKAVQELRNSLKGMGDDFIAAAVPIVQKVVEIVKWFENLPGIIKSAAIGGIITVAIAGPIIMLTGLFANLVGQGFKLIGTVTKMILPFKLLTAEEAAEQLVSKRSLVQWNASQTALGRLTAIVNDYTVALRANSTAAASAAASQTSLTAAGMVAAGTRASGITVMPTRSQIGQTSRASTISTNTSRSIGGGVMTAGVLGSMVAPSGSAGTGISSAVMMTGMLLTLLPQVGTRGAAAFAKMGGGIKKILPGVSGVGKSLAGVLSAAGPAGIALGAVAAGALFAWNRTNKEIAETKRRMDSIANSAKDWSEILSFGYTESSPMQKQKNSPEDIVLQNVKQIQEKNQDLYKMLQDMQTHTEADKIATAINEGMKVRLHGGSVEAAEDAAQAALRVMGMRLSKTELKAKIAPEVDFNDWDQMAERLGNNIGDTINKAVSGKFEGQDGPWESFGRFFSGKNDINSVAAASIKESIDQFYQLFSSMEGDARQKAFDAMQQKASQGLLDVYNSMDIESKSRLNIRSFDDFLKAVKDQRSGGGVFSGVSENQIAAAAGVSADKLNKMADAYQAVVQAIAEANHISPEQAEKLYDIAQLAGISGVEVTKLGNDMQRTGNYGQYYSGQLAAGANSTDAMGSSASDATGEISTFTSAIDDFNNALQETVGISWSDVVSSMKDAMADSMSVVTDLGNDMFSDKQSDIMDAYKARGQAAIDAIDKQSDALDKKVDDMKKRHDDEQKAMEASYDARIKKVQDSIDAEQKAEDIRQRIFEKEKTRLERMADLANSTIDFNSALRSGNLDEAARVQTAASAQQMQWALDDSGQAAGDASKARLDALNAQKDVLDQQKQDALDALKAKQDQEDEKLKIENDARKKSIEAEKNKQAKINDANERSKQRQLKAQEKLLQNEVAAVTAYIPKNAAERQAQVAKLEAIYKKYGVDLTTAGKGWANIIATELNTQMTIARNKLGNQAQWAKVGNDAVASMIQGGLGMSIAQFQAFLETGDLPQGFSMTKARNKAVSQGVTNKLRNMPSHHSGGIVGMGGSTRAGFASNAPRSAREVETRLLAGEGVLNRGAIKNLGTDFVDQANKGQIPAGIGGPDLVPGMAGMMAGVIAAASKSVMKSGINSAYNQALANTSGWLDLSTSATAGKAGKYGGSVFGAEQMQNAATIISVGKSLGATNRDLIIALMTAMQESTLRNLNYGDRDSLGLFQQRNAWGSASDRTNPVEATKMFFRGGHGGQRGLFAFKDRDKMTLAQAAQAVQVSAFPDAYAKWEDEARAIIAGTNVTNAGSGRYTKPLNAYRVSSGYGYRTHPITGKRTFHDGIDLAAPTGTPIRSALPGQVVRAGWNGGYGNYTAIASGNLLVGYGHQSRIGVRSGQQIGQGAVIGAVGSTGASTGPHLHLLTHRGGRSVDPRSVFPGLRKGAFTLSDGYAKLHKSEAVLTAPLTEKLKDGINNLDKSVHSRYDVRIDMRGATVSSEIDFQRSVEKALRRVDERKGVSRNVG